MKNGTALASSDSLVCCFNLDVAHTSQRRLVEKGSAVIFSLD